MPKYLFCPNTYTGPVSPLAPTGIKPIILLSDQPGNCEPLRCHLAARGLPTVELLLDEVSRLHARWLDQRPPAIMLDLAPASDRSWEIVRLRRISRSH